MPTELPKNYDPATVETEVYQTWLNENAFTPNPADPGDPYCIVIPPPNVTGALHLGHAINNTLQDILIRRARMQGKNALWIPGVDHAGIATQAVVEKQLKEKENKTRHDIGREALVERIWKWKEKFGDRILSQLQRLGCSCDWSRTHFTLDDQCARAVRETFFKLFKDGLIYRGKRLVNWDIALQTSISDDEIYHETVKTNLWHIRYPIINNNKAHGWSSVGLPTHMIVATTRPETLLGDTAVAVHSQDPRWNWAIGMQVELPLTGRKIPIIADDILVDPKFGTGVVKVTPAHDPNDYAVWQRHQNKPDQIDLINILNPDGTLNENAGPYARLKRDAARTKIVADLEAAGLLEKTEPYETQVGHSDRSKTPVEPYLSDQWFVQMAPLAEPALEVVRNGTIKFFPERHAQQYLSWLGEKRDWPISRQLWWGHRIPIWTRKYKVPVDGTSLPEFQYPDLTGTNCQMEIQGEWDPEEQAGTVTVALSALNADAEAVLEREGFTQDPDVLDTWFSSALWPHSTLGWPDDTADLRKWYPTTVLLTGRDIVTLWVARMVMMGMYNMGQPTESSDPSTIDPSPQSPRNSFRGSSSMIQSSDDSMLRSLGIPFHHVAINPTILDGHGERMSKSKGNGVDPVDIIETHGADALRFTLATMATETQDVRLPVKKLPDGRNTSDKFDFGRNFCNKLWNATRFVLSAIQNLTTENNQTTETKTQEEFSPCLRASVVKSSLSDRWIASRFNRAIAEANEAIDHYRFDQYAKTIYDFFWRDFCDWYVEAAKLQLKNPDAAPATANLLASLLDGALRLMHPIIPFITERLWWELNQIRPHRDPVSPEPAHEHAELPSTRLISASWPEPGPIDDAAEHVFPKIQEIISVIRTLKNEHQANQKIVLVSLAPPGDDARRMAAENQQLIEELAGCTIKQIQPNLPQPPDTIHAIANGACDIFIEGMVDESAEQARLARRREELQKQITTLNGRLNNAGYLAKAPPHLVEQTKQQLASAEAELQKLN